MFANFSKRRCQTFTMPTTLAPKMRETKRQVAQELKIDKQIRKRSFIFVCVTFLFVGTVSFSFMCTVFFLVHRLFSGACPASFSFCNFYFLLPAPFLFHSFSPFLFVYSSCRHLPCTMSRKKWESRSFAGLVIRGKVSRSVCM